MVVRFLPQPEESPEPSVRDRENLAEVIELRQRLPREVSGRPNADDLVGALEPLRATTFLDGEIHDSPAQQEKVTGSVSSMNAAPASDGALTRSASQDGVRLLARRARSTGELRRELLQLGHADEEVEIVIEEFVHSLYLDDLGLARVLTQNLRERKGASTSQIRMKLRERHLAHEAVELAVAELDEDEELDLLRSAAENRARKLGGLDRGTAERRLVGFLARRGWSGEKASRAAREALDATGPKSGVSFR